MVAAHEVVGEERYFIAPAVETTVALKQGVIDGAEAARCRGDRAHLWPDAGGMAHHQRYDIGTDFAVDDKPHVLHVGATDTVVGRIVGKPHDHPVHRRLVGPQHSLKTVVALGAAIDMGVDSVDAHNAHAQICLQATAHEQGRIVGEVGPVDRPSGEQGLVTVRPLDPRSHCGCLEFRERQIESSAVEISHGQGQGRQPRDQVVAGNKSKSPLPVPVLHHRHSVVDLLPRTTEILVRLEDAAAICLSGGAGLLPEVEVVAGGQIVSHGAVKGARRVVVGPGVIPVVGKILQRKVVVERPFPTQIRPRLVYLVNTVQAFPLCGRAAHQGQRGCEEYGSVALHLNGDPQSVTQLSSYRIQHDVDRRMWVDFSSWR